MRIYTLATGTLALFLLGTAQAQEVARVVTSSPILQQVAVPRQVCQSQAVVQQPQKSGAGAVMGALAGAAVGNAVGKGSGNTVATALGVVGGAMLGDSIEGQPAPQVHHVQSCSNQMFYETRTTGYNVVYEFNGRQYTAVMPSDPGPTVRLQITPVIAPPPLYTPAQPAAYPVPPVGSAPQS